MYGCVLWVFYVFAYDVLCFMTGFMRVLRFMPGFIWVLCVLCECVYECLCLFYMCLCMCFICAFYVCFIAL
jgi:hypothetical protein